MTSGETADVTSNTRARLVTATIELFRVGGYNGTSLKDVTQAADAPMGSLYHYFKGGKDELAEVALREAGATYKQLLEAVWDDADDPAAAIRAFFDGAADVVESTDFIDPCPVGTVARETASTNEPLRLAAAAVFQSWTDEIVRRLMQTADADPQVLASIAHTAVAAIEGGFILSRTNRDGAVLRSIGEQIATLYEYAAPSGSRSAPA